MRCCRFTFLILFLFASALWAATNEVPKLRLGDAVRPVKYAVDLTLLPENLTFSGAIDIDIEIQESSSVIWLNAKEITIKEVSLKSDNKIQTPVVEPAGEEFVGLRLTSNVPPGPAKLHIQYSGKISPKNSEGIFQGRDGENVF